MIAQRSNAGGRPDDDLHRLDHLSLPAHVNVLVHGSWRPGWLIGCDNQMSGWHGLVQFQDEYHTEITEWIPAEQIMPTGD